VQDAEYPVELFYNINFTPRLAVSPAVQYVIHDRVSPRRAGSVSDL
jgi:carbohydrate-selective porin OprB